MLSLFRFFRSVRHAVRGIFSVYRTEQNFRIQCICALFINTLAIVIGLTWERRLIILIVSASVLVLELLNSAVERLLDLLKPRLNEYAGDVKDVMAGAVLVASVVAVIVGVCIFWPYMTTFLARV
jgi:diacylglycerol kinase